MDTDTYPRQEVQEFLKQFVCVRVNCEDKGEGEKTAGRFGVNSYPRLMVLGPLEKKLVEVRGRPQPEHFNEGLIQHLPHDMTVAAQDHKFSEAAEKMVVLRHWLEGTSARKSADDWYARLESDADFKAAYDAAQKQLEDDLAKAKEEAERAKAEADKARLAAEEKERKDLMAEAAGYAKKDKRKDAIECWKKVVERWPDSAEAKTARDKLKFFGVKMEDPPKK